MKLLAIDTTREFGSLALLEDGEPLEEVLLHSPDGFSAVLFDHIARLLASHGATPDDVACFAAASGPGSFTGVRVGMAAVKGLAEATGKPAVAVSNLEALAWFGSAPLRATLLDARRGEIYGAVYDARGRAVQPECVRTFPAWLERLPAEVTEFIGIDWAPFRAALAGTRFEQARIVEAPRALAAAVGRVAWKHFETGGGKDPAAIDANYVRRSDAELFWKDA